MRLRRKETLRSPVGQAREEPLPPLFSVSGSVAGRFGGSCHPVLLQAHWTSSTAQGSFPVKEKVQPTLAGQSACSVMNGACVTQRK